MTLTTGRWSIWKGQGSHRVQRMFAVRLDRNDDPFSDFRELDGAQPQTGNGQNDARKEELRQVSVTLPYLRYIKLYETKSILIDCFL